MNQAVKAQTYIILVIFLSFYDRSKTKRNGHNVAVEMKPWKFLARAIESYGTEEEKRVLEYFRLFSYEMYITIYTVHFLLTDN